MAVEKLEIETYFGKCKCCLKYGYLRTMWEEHVVEEETEVYGQMLIECFSIEWTIRGSEEDDQICEDCIWKVREAYLFKKQVLRAQNKLEQSDDVEENKSEPDTTDYIVEYLEEDILEYSNSSSGNSDDEGDSCKDTESCDKSQSQSQDDDDNDVIFKDDDGDYENDSKEEDNYAPTPRKRKLRQKQDTDSETDAPKPKWPKKLPKEERSKTYKQYSLEALKSAVTTVIAQRMNQKQAAKHYHVPRKTLSAKVREVKNDAEIERPQTPQSENDRNDAKEFNELAMLTLKKHRENINSILAYSNATPIRGYWGVGLVCAFCPEQFTKAAELKTHCSTHGDLSKLYVVPHVRTHVSRLDVTDLKCNICNTKMEDLKTLMHHLKDYHSKPMHFDINNHMVPFKFDTKELECVECGEQFKHFKYLSEHMTNTHYRNYVCVECDRGFVNKVNLLSHKDTHKIGKFYCNFCTKLFDTRRKKTTHERLAHILQTKTEKCGYCKMRFQNVAQKNNHEMRAHKKQRCSFSCNACDKSYTHQRTLRDHINKEHLLSRPYKCTEEGCIKSFFLRKTLQAHILTHCNARPFRCSLCPKAYRSVKTLKEHTHYHNDRKEFKCPKCPKSYVVHDNFVKHLKEKHE